MDTGKVYIAIDLKSFYASVECVERGFDPLTHNLVVADESRTDKTICLAVSPSLKAYGIPGRPRLFEVKQKVNELNRQNPSLHLSFTVAVPRMGLYKKYSRTIRNIYLRHIAEEDMHVYSIDEVFIDVTPYLKVNKMTGEQMAQMMIKEVLSETGITATAGVGTNLYLAKVAMDIVAKHMPADENGVRIAFLDEMSYRRELWNHRPITDFWRVGRGISERLAQFDMYTMGQVALMSEMNEKLLYDMFGVNAELLIDHAWGWEPVTIAHIKAYRPSSHSLSNGQVLATPYENRKALTVIQEMADNLSMELLDKHLVADHVTVTVSYDSSNLTDAAISTYYKGPVKTDHYGRAVPKSAHGSKALGTQTSSSRLLREAVREIFVAETDKRLLVRYLNVSVDHVVPESQATELGCAPVQLDMFADNSEIMRHRAEQQKEIDKEKRVQQALLNIRKRFGKNAALRGLNFDEGATARERNTQIGGHRE